VVNDEQATIVRTIFNWYINGLNNVKNPSIKAISLECIKLDIINTPIAKGTLTSY
jgi:hypothetical protein